MKAAVTALLLAFSSSSSLAASDAFKDSYRAYHDMRKIEEQSALFSLRTDLEPEDQKNRLSEISSRLTQARIDFHSILPAEEGNFSEWEKKVIKRLGKSSAKLASPDPESVTFLQKTHPRARELSAFEWQVMAEFFGVASQRAFLHSSFAAEATPSAKEGTSANKGSKSALWINTPSFPILSSAEISAQKKERALAAKKLMPLGYIVEELTVSPFIRIEDQAEDLQKSLKNRLEKGELYLLSSGPASAVLLRTFELYPELLHHPEILGWLNLNGKLFGAALPIAERRPASVSKVTPADRQHMDVKQEFLLLQLERLERQAPLGAKFPVMNIVTTEGKSGSGENLRESVVPEGRTFFMESGGGLSGIEKILPTMASP